MSSERRPVHKSVSSMHKKLELSLDNILSPLGQSSQDNNKRLPVKETALTEQIDTLEKEKVLMECELK